MLTKGERDGSWGAARGWNAGAVSAPVLAGNVRLDYQPDVGVIGAIVGLRADANQWWITPGLIQHGFFCAGTVGTTAQPIERNALVGSRFAFASGDTLSIVRDNGVVTYLHNDALIYTSQAASRGRVRAAACLYAAGDAIA